ncbi:hypothetical protein MFIFM68171_02311 [Madurella fahalii]|uniref:Uncharacterized protein n=1 Tax=Madurella fahalii TaxID=1157608 RepID=A0ABQ0G2Y7_9PEZI
MFRLPAPYKTAEKTVIVREQNNTGSLSSQANPSLDQYIIRFKRPDAPSTRVAYAQENRAKVPRLLEKMRDPEHRLFTSSAVDGLGENLGTTGESGIVTDTHPTTAVRESEEAAEPPTSFLLGGSSRLWEAGTSSSTATDASLLRELMLRRELWELPFDTRELSRIWDAEQGGELQPGRKK